MRIMPSTRDEACSRTPGVRLPDGSENTCEAVVVGRGADDERWMGAAIEIAREGLVAGELPIGAVVVARGVIVGRAHTCEHREKRLLVHAELLALDEADRTPGWDRRSSTLYTTLEPCIMCIGAAATAMVGRVVYAIPSAGDGAARFAGDWSRRRSNDLPHVTLPSVASDVGRMAAEALFEQFIERRDGNDPMAQWARTLLSTPA
jgi:tRNA(adenine34) deaminase